MLSDLRRGLDALEHVAGKIIFCQRQQLSNCRFVVDLDKTIGKLRLTQSQHFIKTSPQTFVGALVRRVALTETMNHRTFQRRREICRWFRRFGIVPNRHLIRRRQLQDTIEVVLSRAALIVNQLRDTKAVNRVAALRTERVYERKWLVQRIGRMHARLWRSVGLSLKLLSRLAAKIHC